MKFSFDFFISFRSRTFTEICLTTNTNIKIKLKSEKISVRFQNSKIYGPEYYKFKFPCGLYRLQSYLIKIVCFKINKIPPS